MMKERAMNRILSALVLCLAAGAAMAGGSVRFGNQLVNSGDSAGKVTQVAGKPDRVIQLESEYSGNIGERWEYYQQRKTIQVTFRDGRVTDVRELFN
jgi:ketosteroid isomerase-like protein